MPWHGMPTPLGQVVRKLGDPQRADFLDIPEAECQVRNREKRSKVFGRAAWGNPLKGGDDVMLTQD